jgi:hypothetical protein
MNSRKLGSHIERDLRQLTMTAKGKTSGQSESTNSPRLNISGNPRSVLALKIAAKLSPTAAFIIPLEESLWATITPLLEQRIFLITTSCWARLWQKRSRPFAVGRMVTDGRPERSLSQIVKQNVRRPLIDPN